MTKLILSFFLLVKVFVGFVTTEKDEPHFIESFVAGYESSGLKWDPDNMQIEDSIDATEFSAQWLSWMYANDFEIGIRNSGIAEDIRIDSFYMHGIQCVIPVGANTYHTIAYKLPLPCMILSGAGDTSNQTSIHCEFFSTHPFSDYPITSMTKGDNDTVYITVNTSANGGFIWNPFHGVKFSGVSGWQNNPSGIHMATYAGGYNRFRINYNVGNGEFSSGTAKIYFQSYSTPYLAGQFAGIRDKLGCSNWEARYRMRVTASGNGNFDPNDGFGEPNISAALTYSGPIPADPFNTLGNIGNIEVSRIGNEVTINTDSVDNALRYELLDREKLLAVNNAPFVDYKVKISRNNRSEPHEFWYRAIRGEQRSNDSEKVRIYHNKYKKLRVK